MFNDDLQERYELAMERIAEIPDECKSMEFSEYFSRTADFILQMNTLYKDIQNDALSGLTIEELSRYNHELYRDIIKENYERSFADPAFSVSKMGELYGRLLSFLYVEIRGMIVYAYEGRLFDLTILAELFLEIYCIFQNEKNPKYKELYDSVYWFVSDYSDVTIEYRVAEMLTDISAAKNIIMNEDLNDLRYLYKFGEYITENELDTARYLNSLKEEQIKDMARTFTEGFRKGFILGNKDLSKKKIVQLRYCIGFERLVREEIRQFKEMGLDTVIFRAAVNTINKKMNIKVGYYSAGLNKQMEYDHRFDNALYMDNDFVTRKLGALRTAYEKYKQEANVVAGPAVMEIFGELPFEPEDKKECYQLEEKQQKLSVKYDSESAKIINEYIKGEERSFTIIAYPVPEIGNDFEEIFKETVKINTLDYDLYKGIQQAMIDVLDTAAYVEIKGRNGNKTDLKVSLMQIENPAEQTIFENCLADVNIPVGEIFTSPVLKGTTGVLNVSEVYLRDLKYKNLTLLFEDGMVKEYTCENFEEEEKNKDFIKENLLYNHETLPIGEFAVGTNTAAYVMANRYDIVYKLPILIAEKMGPHFAVGDTCYTWSEEVKVYNPDGKEIIAKDNEISILRKTDIQKAYFNCHTDITIPYDEIGEISAVKEDGSKVVILKDGRFILEGTQELNSVFG